MSYTYPAQNAVNFTFTGDGAYTYPAQNAVNFSFEEASGPPEAVSSAPSVLGAAAGVAAMGVLALAGSASPLGASSAAAHVFTVALSSASSMLGGAAAKAGVQASGIGQTSSPLGAAIVRAVMGGRAIGSAPAVLGEAGAIAENPVTHVQGSSLTQYGAHSAAAIIVADGVSTTQYGGVLARYDVSVSVDAALPSTRAGVAIAWHIEYQAVATVHDAYGPCLTGYGSPSAGHPQLGDVQGAALTGYGSAHAALIAQPVSVCTTVAGAPSLVGIASLPGVRTTKYGTPSNVIAHIVSGVCRTRYGKAKIRFPDAHMVYGLNNGRRAGVPRAVELT